MVDVGADIDDEAVAAVAALGGLTAIAPSHPHHFGCQLEWSRAFGGVPVWVNAADLGWVQRPAPEIVGWSGTAEPAPGLTLHQVGGHLPESSVVLWPAGAEGREVLLSGDPVAPVPAAGWVGFARSHPNKIPLSGAVVARMARTLAGLTFDRIYDEFAGSIDHDAHAAVQRSAARHVAWVGGEHDHLT